MATREFDTITKGLVTLAWARGKSAQFRPVLVVGAVLCRSIKTMWMLKPVALHWRPTFIMVLDIYISIYTVQACSSKGCSTKTVLKLFDVISLQTVLWYLRPVGIMSFFLKSVCRCLVLLWTVWLEWIWSPNEEWSGNAGWGSYPRTRRKKWMELLEEI